MIGLVQQAKVPDLEIFLLAAESCHHYFRQQLVAIELF